MNDVCRLFARFLPIALTLLLSSAAAPAAIPAKPPATGSRCIALAQSIPNATYVSLQSAALAKNEVSITFVGHATFRIETPGGVIIATDFTGYGGPGRLPDVVTMNHAHSSHYTDFPDPKIKYVLRGWGTEGKPAAWNLTVGDVMIRNVTTDIRGWNGVREKDGNSIFIFEVADLCIGHLGHLHHKLGPEYLGLIGQLDVVMVPVDGAYTMEQAAMVEVLKVLKARLILPMHYFNQFTLSRFLSQMGESFDVEVSDKPTVVISAATLPQTPKILTLRGHEFITTDP
jgi:L-ascorbate metabolism protein UlaG (beta-lactamase superfamily)